MADPTFTGDTLDETFSNNDAIKGATALENSTNGLNVEALKSESQLQNNPEPEKTVIPESTRIKYAKIEKELHEKNQLLTKWNKALEDNPDLVETIRSKLRQSATQTGGTDTSIARQEIQENAERLSGHDIERLIEQKLTKAKEEEIAQRRSQEILSNISQVRADLVDEEMDNEQSREAKAEERMLIAVQGELINKGRILRGQQPLTGEELYKMANDVLNPDKMLESKYKEGQMVGRGLSNSMNVGIRNSTFAGTSAGGSGANITFRNERDKQQYEYLKKQDEKYMQKGQRSNLAESFIKRYYL